MADPVVTLTNGVPTAGSGNITTLGQLIDPAGGPAVIKATAPLSTDKAIVVAISPNGVNANLSDGSLQTGAHLGAPVVGLDPYSQYEFVAASTTSALGATGAIYDYLAGVLIVPATAAAGVVQIKDGAGSAITIFAGGATTALADLKPFLVPLGLHSLSGAWSLITNANVSAIGIGKFT